MIRAFQWDLARQVERLDFLKTLLPHYARWGFEELYLHLEDAVQYPSLPDVARADAYTYKNFSDLVRCATDVGIRVVPIVNLLGHTQYLVKEPGLRDLNELRDADDQPLERGQICPLHPRTLEVAEKLLRDVLPFCTAGKVHVGLDESFHLGKCPRCREEVAKIGLGGHFAGHVQRLHQLCSRLDLRMGIWADMLYFVPEAISQLPRGITAYDWYYYSFAKSPRVEFFNYAERDLAPALKRQGIRYYGCPMNGAFRHEPLPVFGDRLGNIRSWWQRCLKTSAEGFLITSWEADRLSLETTTVVDAAAAGLWLETESDDNTTLLAQGMARLFQPKNPQSLSRLLLAADGSAFMGYARWQINQRWDICPAGESLKPYQAEERFFARLCAMDGAWPKAFEASFIFRHYLAQRDIFVRETARRVFKLRRLFHAGKLVELTSLLTDLKQSIAQFSSFLRQGDKAARAMATRSREKRARSTNQSILEADAARLKELRSWLTRAGRNQATVMQASSVSGAWQLQFTVHNFAPAVQKVVVEEANAGGEWHEIIARHTIEFRSHAARPHTKIKREFVAPLATAEAKLRIAVRGVGQVAVSHITLTNGVTAQRSARFRQRKILGHEAPKRGFPVLDAQPDSVLLIKWVE